MLFHYAFHVLTYYKRTATGQISLVGTKPVQLLLILLINGLTQSIPART